MTNRIRGWAAVLPAIAALGWAGGVWAAEQRPLPAFTVMSMEGRAVPSEQLRSAGQWLVIYVTPTSPASIRLLSAMTAWESPAMSQRVVVLVGGTLEGAQQFVAERTREFPAVQWFADPRAEAWKALRLTGTPYLLGVRDSRIAWSLAGVLNDPATLESVIRSWVEK